MHCTTCRTQIHDWFDTQGASAMPPDVSEHVRDCSDCRSFIKNWNSVELGLQSVRDQSVTLSADFSTSLRARLAREEGRRWARFRFPTLPSFNYGRLALAALAVVVIMLAVKYSGNVKAILLPAGSNMARSTVQPRTDEIKPTIPPDLPIAKQQ